MEKSPLRAAIAGHFAALKNQKEEVKAWGITIWFDPVTPLDRVKFNAIDDDMERSVVVLIEKAKNEDGTKCFTAADKGWLMREAGANIVQFTAQRILLADLVEVKTLGKPSPPTTEA
jgi:hypothetical protein